MGQDGASGQLNGKGTRLRAVLAPCIIGAFFCFLFFYYGVGEYPDSATYLSYDSDRDPLYPLFLMACRALFGARRYLRAAVFLQNVFAFLATWYLYRFLAAHFRLNGLFRAGALVVLLAPHLLTGVFTPSGIILTNAVLSEGLTISLYPLFAALLLEAFFGEKSARPLAGAYVAALLLSLARGQLMPLMLVWGIVAAAGAVRREILAGQKAGLRRAVAVFLFLLAAAGGFALRSAAVKGYHYVMSGSAQGTAGGNITLLTNVLYCADEQTVGKAERTLSAHDRELLDTIYGMMKEQGLTVSDAGSGLHAKILHHEDCHDRIKFDILNEVLRREAWTAAPEGGSGKLRMEMDRAAGRLMRAVLPHCAGSFFATYLYVAAGGLIRTVSLLSPLFSAYALLIYIVAIALMCYLFIKGKNKDSAWMMAVVLLMILANVCATALTIMCLSRYMIYNMPLFYLAGLVCLQELWRMRRRGNGE